MKLRESLVELGESMPAARLTPDVWRRGRRARTRTRWTRVGAAAAVVGLVVAVAPWSGPAPQTVGDGGSTVPRTVGVPWMWQATVQMDAPGPASVLFGGDTIGLHGTDLFDSEGKLAVVGRDSGDTRMLLYSGVDDITAGEDVLLSPDGTRVASPFVEGVDGSGLVVTDLTTGASRRYTGGTTDCCAPVAWAPDGRSLLAARTGAVTYSEPSGIGRPDLQLVLLDLATGSVTQLGGFRPAHEIRRASWAAFVSNDRFVVSVGTTVSMLDRTGATLWTTDLGPNRYLAGAGAYDRRGDRIATVGLGGCLGRCDTAGLAARTWTLGFLDPRSGQPVTTPTRPSVTGMSVRAVGWTDDGELVLLRHTPERGAAKEPGADWDDTGWFETGHVTLLGVRPDGPVRTLLDPPDGVLTMDVAADLIAAGRFGGPPSEAGVLPARPIVWLVAAPLLGVTLVGLAIAGLIIRWRHRRAYP